ncbi:uncharacterized protein LOC113782351 [Coffea eugenioides]|uniref:uncharacterized protein LOC113782351 n=1 Tax=Coffea eugenioides TaxID=49369 RepID=UPI000F607467|nr:uncharacterized protein LOC113782351 [Coffea eugenioides]
MLDIFAALGYPEERQIVFAVFQFEGAARAWWNVIRAKWDREQTPWTWVNFTREFNEKYLPPLIQERREDEFIRLRQGTMSVAEYETQFTKLSRFAPELVLTDQRRIRRFVQGLNVEIQEALAAAQLETYSQAIEKAQRIESSKSQVKAFHDKKRRHPDTSSYLEGQSSGSEPPPKKSRGIGGPRSTGMPNQGNVEKNQVGRETQRGASRGGPTSGPRMAYGFCGAANHIEDNCWKKGQVRKCYRCGSAEHLIAQYAHLPKEGNLPRAKGNTSKPTNATGNRPKVPARTYAIGSQEVTDPLPITEGTFPIFHRIEVSFYSFNKIFKDH